ASFLAQVRGHFDQHAVVDRLGAGITGDNIVLGKHGHCSSLVWPCSRASVPDAPDGKPTAPVRGAVRGGNGRAGAGWSAATDTGPAMALDRRSRTLGRKPGMGAPRSPRMAACISFHCDHLTNVHYAFEW